MYYSFIKLKYNSIQKVTFCLLIKKTQFMDNMISIIHFKYSPKYYSLCSMLYRDILKHSSKILLKHEKVKIKSYQFCFFKFQKTIFEKLDIMIFS